MAKTGGSCPFSIEAASLLLCAPLSTVYNANINPITDDAISIMLRY